MQTNFLTQVIVLALSGAILAAPYPHGEESNSYKTVDSYKPKPVSVDKFINFIEEEKAAMGGSDPQTPINDGNDNDYKYSRPEAPNKPQTKDPKKDGFSFGISLGGNGLSGKGGFSMGRPSGSYNKDPSSGNDNGSHGGKDSHDKPSSGNGNGSHGGKDSYGKPSSGNGNGSHGGKDSSDKPSSGSGDGSSGNGNGSHSGKGSYDNGSSGSGNASHGNGNGSYDNGSSGSGNASHGGESSSHGDKIYIDGKEPYDEYSPSGNGDGSGHGDKTYQGDSHSDSSKGGHGSSYKKAPNSTKLGDKGMINMATGLLTDNPVTRFLGAHCSHGHVCPGKPSNYIEQLKAIPTGGFSDVLNKQYENSALHQGKKNSDELGAVHSTVKSLTGY